MRYLSSIKGGKLLIQFFLLFYGFQIYSQCAGLDNSVVICEKEKDTDYQSFNLFDQLIGTPQTGGIWSSENPLNNFALDEANGEVDLWRINRFGEHRFTYTNASCGESATITVFLGGYPGEDNVDGGANVCSSNSNVSLFTFLDNNLLSLNADLNGIWEVGSGTPATLLFGSIFNAESAGAGTYTFTYTVGQVKTCTSRFATVILEVHRAPIPGDDADIIICTTDNLTAYTNINLFDHIDGEDDGGLWFDNNGTGEITSLSDSEINIQEIFNNFGSGIYSFTYEVFPTHGICSEESATVNIILPELSAKFEINDRCSEGIISGKITHGFIPKVNVTYDLTYEVINSETNNSIFSDTIMDIDFLISDPVLRDFVINEFSFTIPVAFSAGNYAIKTVSTINNIGCDSFTVTEDRFSVYNPQINIEDRCYATDIVDIEISDLVDNNSILSDRTEFFDYIISNSTDSETIDVVNFELAFINGKAILPVDFSMFHVSITDYNITISSTTNASLNCINHNFKITRVPDDIELSIAIDNSCDARIAEVVINAPTLINGNYMINYEVKKTDSADILIDNSITFDGGFANFNVDITTLETGTYEILLKSVQNDTTLCRTEFDFQIKDSFSIGGIPDSPVLEANQTFCLSDFLPNQPVIADIAVQEGENLTWYADDISANPLAITTLLIDGTTYFVTSSNSTMNCESSVRSIVTVRIISPSDISSGNTTPTFCQSDMNTLADLDATSNSGTILWYDVATGGTTLDLTTPLENRKSYFAVENIQGCEYKNRLEFQVTVTTPPKPEYKGNLSLCSLDKLTLFDLESDITPDSEFNLIWFDAAEGDSELSNSSFLQENVNYYIGNVHQTEPCESERTLISVSLSGCDPNNYNFFIPDGFSPNNDGTNDQYFIPFIEYFYPDYEFEIFNRYGQSLFKGGIENPEWDGQNTSGIEVVNGVYFYILRFNKDNLKPKQGRIYLSK